MSTSFEIDQLAAHLRSLPDQVAATASLSLSLEPLALQVKHLMDIVRPLGLHILSQKDTLEDLQKKHQTLREHQSRQAEEARQDAVNFQRRVTLLEEERTHLKSRITSLEQDRLLPRDIERLAKEIVVSHSDIVFTPLMEKQFDLIREDNRLLRNTVTDLKAESKILFSRTEATATELASVAAVNNQRFGKIENTIDTYQKSVNRFDTAVAQLSEQISSDIPARLRGLREEILSIDANERTTLSNRIDSQSSQLLELPDLRQKFQSLKGEVLVALDTRLDAAKLPVLMSAVAEHARQIDTLKERVQIFKDPVEVQAAVQALEAKLTPRISANDANLSQLSHDVHNLRDAQRSSLQKLSEDLDSLRVLASSTQSLLQETARTRQAEHDILSARLVSVERQTFNLNDALAAVKKTLSAVDIVDLESQVKNLSAALQSQQAILRDTPKVMDLRAVEKRTDGLSTSMKEFELNIRRLIDAINASPPLLAAPEDVRPLSAGHRRKLLETFGRPTRREVSPQRVAVRVPSYYSIGQEYNNDGVKGYVVDIDLPNRLLTLSSKPPSDGSRSITLAGSGRDGAYGLNSSSGSRGHTLSLEDA